MFPTVFSKHCIQRTHHRLNTGEVRTNWLTHNVRRTNKENKDWRERERKRESSVTEKSQKINTLLFKIIMKKYKQFYKYSYCVINHLHVVQHTRWTYFFFFCCLFVLDNRRYNVSCCVSSSGRFFFSRIFIFFARVNKNVFQLDRWGNAHTHLFKHTPIHLHSYSAQHQGSHDNRNEMHQQYKKATIMTE